MHADVKGAQFIRCWIYFVSHLHDYCFVSGDELLSDSFPYKELFEGVLWEVEGKVRITVAFAIDMHLLFNVPVQILTSCLTLQWVVQGAVSVDIGANPSAEGADEDEGVDDQAVKVVDIVDTFRLQVNYMLPIITIVFLRCGFGHYLLTFSCAGATCL